MTPNLAQVATEGDEFVTAPFHAVDALREPDRSYVSDHVVDELPVEQIAQRHVGRSRKSRAV